MFTNLGAGAGLVAGFFLAIRSGGAPHPFGVMVLMFMGMAVGYGLGSMIDLAREGKLSRARGDVGDESSQDEP